MIKNNMIYLNLKKIDWHYFLIGFLLVLLFIAVFFRQVYVPYKFGFGQNSVFHIEQGEGCGDIASRLRKEKIISSSFFFNLASMIFGVNNNLQAGTYNLSPSMTMVEILNKLSSGDILKEKITIIEGWAINDISRFLKEKDFFQPEEFAKFSEVPGKDFLAEFEFLKGNPENSSLEGYFFPDTYEFKRTEGVEKLIRKVLGNFEKKIDSETGLKEKIKSQGRTLRNIITMASILEKEVKNYEDKRIVAGILWKRISSGWPLQVDSTLTYLTGKASSELTKDDLRMDSKYNTYKYLGLPIGPICNPGMESIKAAVYYKNSDYWFYLTTPDDKTVFSRTLEEHAINKAKYLK